MIFKINRVLEVVRLGKKVRESAAKVNPGVDKERKLKVGNERMSEIYFGRVRELMRGRGNRQVPTKNSFMITHFCLTNSRSFKELAHTL